VDGIVLLCGGELEGVAESYSVVDGPVGECDCVSGGVFGDGDWILVQGD